MKKVTGIIAASVIIFACAKEKLNFKQDKEITLVVSQQKNIYAAAGTVTKVNPETTKTTYPNSNLILWETQGKNGLSDIRVQLGNKSDYITGVVQSFPGYNLVSLKTTSGVLLCSWKKNSAGQIADPQSGPNPVLINTGISFAQCLMNLINECNQYWSCRAFCGLGLVGCLFSYAALCAVSPNVN